MNIGGKVEEISLVVYVLCLELILKKATYAFIFCVKIADVTGADFAHEFVN